MSKLKKIRRGDALLLLALIATAALLLVSNMVGSAAVAGEIEPARVIIPLAIIGAQWIPFIVTVLALWYFERETAKRKARRGEQA